MDWGVTYHMIQKGLVLAQLNWWKKRENYKEET